MRHILRILAPWLALTGAALAQTADVRSASGLAGPLDNTGVAARALGMGSAFVAVADDSSALFWNPAGLSSLSSLQASLHHLSWINGVFQETAVLALPTGGKNGFALGIHYLDYGTFTSSDEFGNETGSYHPLRMGLALGWGGRLSRGFSAGVAAKASRQDLDGTAFPSAALDLGALWSPLPSIRLGAAYSNFGTRVEGAATSGVIRAGASYLLPSQPRNQGLVCAAATLQPYGAHRLHFGAEQWFLSKAALRAGYQLDLGDDPLGSLHGLTAGFGLRLQRFQLDYAYLPQGDLGTSQRVSLSYSLEDPISSPSPTPTATTTPSPTASPTATPRAQVPGNPAFPDLPGLPSKPGPSTLSHTPGTPTPTPAPFVPGDGEEKLQIRFDFTNDTAPAGSPTPSAKEGPSLQDLKAAVQKNPQDYRAWMALGRFYYDSRQKELAIQCYEQVLRLRPDLIKLRNWLEGYKSRQ